MSKIFKRIDYLKSKQDHLIKNFGMVSMGYVVEILNEYEAENIKLESELSCVTEMLKESIKYTYWYIETASLLPDVCSDLDEEDQEMEMENIKHAKAFIKKVKNYE